MRVWGSSPLSSATLTRPPRVEAGIRSPYALNVRGTSFGRGTGKAPDSLGKRWDVSSLLTLEFKSSLFRHLLWSNIMEHTMTFITSPKEQKLIDDFIERQNSAMKELGMGEGRFVYKFSQNSGIGTAVEIENTVTGVKLDVTDYSSW